jgi:steroid 5-alpha reductase family enzyme
MTAAALHLVLPGGLAVLALMFVLWLVFLRTDNAAVVDVGWAGGLALLALVYAALGGGDALRKILIAGMASIWGFRLAIYLLFARVIGQPEEGRYVQLRADWKTHVRAKFLLFFEFQALLCVVLSIPFLLPALNRSPKISWVELAGCAIWLTGIVGEAVADAQLNRFKKNSANRGRTCRAGLWSYSRHPNYFFEWVIWMGFAVFALGSPFGYVAFLSPALILYFLLRVTGIPATEAQAIRSKGDDYRAYQRTTSAFVPWFPKKERAA